MTNRIIAIYDGLTDTYIEREATDAEQTEIDANEAEVAARLLALEQAQAEAVLAKETAQAKLAALGLSTADLKALGL
jgi:hypothetical protein